MKTSKFFVVAFAALTLFSCSQETDLTPKAPEGLPATLSLKVSGSSSASTRATGTPSSTDEAKVTRVAVLVFKTNGALDGMDEFESAELTNLKTAKFSITSGTRDIYVVANAPAGTFASVDNKTTFFALKEDLATQIATSLTMSGEKKGVAIDAGDNTIGEGSDKFTISRIASRVTLAWTLPTSPSPYVGKITVDGVYMLNVKTESTYASATENALVPSPLVTSTLGHGLGSDPALDNQPTGTWTALSYLKADGATSGSVYFYAFENAVDAEATKIVIKATYNDGTTSKTVYYPIVVNKVNANTSIGGGAAGTPGDHVYMKRNNQYNISATIQGIGSDSPWDDITPAALEMTVTVATWAAEITQAVAFN